MLLAATVSSTTLLPWLCRDKLFDDRAVGAMVPLTGADKRAQRLGHAPQLCRAALELTYMSESNRSDICAVAMLVAPKLEEVRNPVEGEPKTAGAANKTQPLHVGHFIVAIAAGGAAGGRSRSRTR